MDYKFDDIIGNSNGAGKYNGKLPIIIVVIVSILCGLIVFFVSYAFFGPKKVKEEPKVDTQVEITDENVQILYRYVSYDYNDESKFLKEKQTSFDSFSNKDKFYYALQFATKNDFLDMNKKENNLEVYSLSNLKVKGYMKRFFGENAVFADETEFTHIFDFENKKQQAKFKYKESDEGYEVTFEDLKENQEKLVKPYYRQLTSATKKADGSLIVNEKVIYTLVEETNKVYKVNIYKDYEHSNLIETRQNLSEEDLKTNPVTMDKYIDKATTISYTFKLNSDNTYYFASSEINS